MPGTPEALILQLSADIRGLEKQMAKAVKTVDGGSRQMERRARAANDNIGAAFGKSFGGQLKRDLDDLTGRGGRLAGVLGGLGPVGVAAAAGVGAFALALGQARKAMDLADEIGDTAAQLNITTDALQEYRYAARLAGVETKDADAAIAGFTKSLGAAQLGFKKQAAIFDALGLDAKSFADTEQGLDAVVDKLSQLPEAQRRAFAGKLGLEPILPLLRNGADGIANLRDEARRLGVVMDADVIAKAAGAKDKLETMSQVIDTQLAVAFADLAPLIADATGALAKFVGAVTGFMQSQNGKLFGAYVSGAAKGFVKGGLIGSAVEAGRAVKAASDFPVINPQQLRDALANGIAPRAATTPPPAAGLNLAGSLASGGRGGGRAKKTETLDLTGFATVEDIERLRKLDEELYYLWSQREVTAKAGPDLSGFVEANGAGLAEFADMLDRASEDVQATLADAIQGGLEAGFEDGLPGVLDYFANLMRQRLFQQLADGLAGSIGKSAGGGIGSFIAGLFRAPAFAGGTDSAPGGLSLVGERGPEFVNIPRGSQVIPNDILRDLAKQPAAATARSFAPTFNVYPQPGMSSHDARRTGRQMGAAALAAMSSASRSGF